MISDTGYTVTEVPLDPSNKVTPEKITDLQLSENRKSIDKRLFHVSENVLGKLRENMKSIDVSKLPAEPEDPIEKKNKDRDSPKRRLTQSPKRSRAERELALRGTELNFSKKEQFFTILTPEESQKMEEEKERAAEKRRKVEEWEKKVKLTNEKDEKFEAFLNKREKNRLGVRKLTAVEEPIIVSPRRKVRDVTRKRLLHYPKLSLAETLPPNFAMGGMELNVSKSKDFFTIASPDEG